MHLFVEFYTNQLATLKFELVIICGPQTISLQSQQELNRLRRGKRQPKQNIYVVNIVICIIVWLSYLCVRRPQIKYQLYYSFSTKPLLLARHSNALDYYQSPDYITSLRLFQIIITTGASGTIMKSSKDAAKICKILSSTNFRLNIDISPNHEGGQDVRNQQVGLSQTY
ncbi:Hypothetical_protein [Hexamita inflata]|uniref:Hypothetical_protein n=1 Tax=Hexamita inflata TaxID=28002 RepID=A0AA86PDU2_9EUKA|nr:Hypothetical protein HINF_LOCUS24461 [Hexamita inflata]CAI9936818.1 Hypothetical protein HINF_LOCUS24463 [Hexamita inflata]